MKNQEVDCQKVERDQPRQEIELAIDAAIPTGLLAFIIADGRQAPNVNLFGVIGGTV